MKKTIIVLSVILLSISIKSKADEGMWLPFLIDRLNYTDMQKMGLNLTAEEIYSVNNSSLKDAIVIFGGGCTGEIISDKGLLLTNHHCGYDRIQAHSSVDHNYLQDGFWAKNLKEELPNEGLTVKFLVRIEDVTKTVLAEVNDEMTEDERFEKVREAGNKITKEAMADNHYDAAVKSFYHGNEYYLFVYETFTDIRFVGAPPSSIGKYGADTDNWMWPRHTGDFSLFRVYSGPDGKPADFAEENIPLKPKHFLPVSVKGVEKGDFSMIFGFPGGTDRYMTSYGVESAINHFNPTIVRVRDKKLKIMRKEMDANEKVNIQYATKYSRTSNYWKYFIGQTRGLKRLKVADKKRELEADFTKWVSQDEKRIKKYGNTIKDLGRAYTDRNKYIEPQLYFSQAIFSGPEIFRYAAGFRGIATEIAKKDADQDAIKAMSKNLKESAKKYFKDYDLSTDKKLFSAMMEMYYNDVPTKYQPEILRKIGEKSGGNFDKYTNAFYDKSIFSSKTKISDFLKNPKGKTITKDPAFVLVNEFIGKYRKLGSKSDESSSLMDKGYREYMAGLREMLPNKKFYPDANFTLRLTYGKVLDYYPADAIHYNYFTTLKGVMEKEDPNNWEFVIPDKLKELYQKKDYGQYGENGVMKVCFLTNHDITGGNSGSPVIDGDGNLIGLAFDGNWEAMSGDIAFEPELQRTINVDIRYVLFIIDKYAGAQNIIDELKIIKRQPKLRKDIKKEVKGAALKKRS